MSDITIAANRILPIDVELYLRTQVQFPDLIIVGKDDSEYKIQFTCKNKNNAAPYTVAASDLSASDKQELVITNPLGTKIFRRTTFGSTGTDGIVFYIAQDNDLNTIGIWNVRVKITEGDVEINYPNVPFLVE